MRYQFEEFAFDTDLRELHRGAGVISIAPQVFDLLEYLIRNRERVVSKDDLINTIWNGRIVSDAALTTRLNAVRVAIGDTGDEQRLIKTLPRKGFRFVGPVRELQSQAGTAIANKLIEPPKSALTLPDKPSIAVLPFANLSSDPEQEYFADGIVEDITMALSLFRWLFVIARNSSFTYKAGLSMLSRSAASLACATSSRVACARPEVAFASRVNSSTPKPEHISGRTTLRGRSRISSACRIT